MRFYHSFKIKNVMKLTKPIIENSHKVLVDENLFLWAVEFLATFNL